MVLHLEILKCTFFFPPNMDTDVFHLLRQLLFSLTSHIVKRKHSCELNSSPDLHLHWLMKGMGVAVSVELESGCEASGSWPVSCVAVRLRRIIVITSLECFDPSCSKGVGRRKPAYE